MKTCAFKTPMGIYDPGPTDERPLAVTRCCGDKPCVHKWPDLRLEVEELRKKLEVAESNSCAPEEWAKHTQRLNEFIPDQANQIRLLETERGMWRATQELDAFTIGKLTRELDRAKRGK